MADFVASLSVSDSDSAPAEASEPRHGADRDLHISVRKISGKRRLLAVSPSTAVEEIRAEFQQEMPAFHKAKLISGHEEITAMTVGEAGLSHECELTVLEMKDLDAAIAAVRSFFDCSHDFDGEDDEEQVDSEEGEFFAALDLLSEVEGASMEQTELLSEILFHRGMPRMFLDRSRASVIEYHVAFGKTLGRFCCNPGKCAEQWISRAAFLRDRTDGLQWIWVPMFVGLLAALVEANDKVPAEAVTHFISWGLPHIRNLLKSKLCVLAKSVLFCTGLASLIRKFGSSDELTGFILCKDAALKRLS